jgi:hypothetical protein
MPSLLKLEKGGGGKKVPHPGCHAWRNANRVPNGEAPKPKLESPFISQEMMREYLGESAEAG